MDFYRPPTSDADGPGPLRRGAGNGLWREGEFLVVDKLSHEFPDRCVICNAPAEGFRLKRTAYWHPSWVYILILISIVVYAVVALIVRKSVALEYGLCPKHKARRVTGIFLGFGGCLTSLIVLILNVTGSSEIVIACFIGAIAFPTIGVIMSLTLRPKLIDDHTARFVAGEAFVASLPRGSP